MERAGEHNQDLSDIDFKQITISFDQYETLSRGLKNLAPNLDLAYGAKAGPIVDSLVYTSLDPETEVTTINAFIDCQKEAGLDEDADDWQQTILSELESYYSNLNQGYLTITLPGETNSIYVTKDFGKQVTLIRTSQYSDGYTVDISTASSQYIDYAISGEYREDENKILEADSQRLYEIFNAWAKVQHIIHQQHPEKWQDEDYRHIHISLDDQPDLSEYFQDEADQDQPAKQPDYRVEFSNLDDSATTREIINHYQKLAKELDSIGGNFAAKERLLQIGTAFTDPEGAAMFHLTAPSFLLHGAPGTGKTELVQAFARGVEAELISINSVDIQSKIIGDSAKLIDQAVEDASRHQGRVVLFFDEIDTLINDSNHVEFRNASKHLGKLIENLAQDHPNVLIAACMNAEEYEVMESIIRPGRLEAIPVKLPESYAEIRDIWYSVLYKDNPPLEYEVGDITVANSEYSDVDIIELAQKSAGLSGADMAHILASLRAKKLLDYTTSGIRRPISQQDILEQIKQHLANRSSDDDNYI